MKDKHNYSDAIEATIAFFNDIFEHSNENPMKILVRMNERRIERGEEPKPYPLIENKDIKHFSESMRANLTTHFEFCEQAALIVDYHPMWMLQAIIDESKIEDKSNFIFNARFPSKMTLVVFHDHIELKLNGDQMPVVWYNDFFLGENSDTVQE